MKITFIGYGHVGARLASHLQRVGNEVTLIVHESNSKSLQTALKMNPKLKTARGNNALSEAEVIFLTVPFDTIELVLKPLQTVLKGKIVVDCTNPVGPNLTHALNNRQSGTEWIQQNLLPDSHIIKSFSIYGFENFEESLRAKQQLEEPAMLFCGNNAAAKQKISELIKSLGWNPVDVGGAAEALHLEHMTLLWIKMVRVQKKQDNFVWSIKH